MENISPDNSIDLSTRTKPPRLIPIPKWNNYHPDPSPSALRWLAYTNKNEFCKKVVIRRGARILINESAYFDWLIENNKD